MSDISKILGSLSNDPTMKKIFENSKASILYGEAGRKEAAAAETARQDQTTKDPNIPQDNTSTGPNPFLGLLLYGISQTLTADVSLDDYITKVLSSVKDDTDLKRKFADIMVSVNPEFKNVENIDRHKNSQPIQDFRKACYAGYDKFVESSPDDIKKQLTKWVTQDKYDKADIIVIIKAWGLKFDNEEAVNRYTAFFTKFKDEDKDAGNIYLSVVMDAIKETAGGISTDVFSIISKIKANGNNHQLIINACYDLLKGPVAKFIDDAILSVQAELGAQISDNTIVGAAGAIGSNNSDKMKNEAVQNSYIFFVLFTYLYLIAEVVTFEVAENYFRKGIDRIVNDIYYEHKFIIAEGVIANTTTIMKNAHYALGKRYKSFTELIGASAKDLEIVITQITKNKQILNAMMSSLISQGLFENVDFDKFLKADAATKPIQLTSLEQKSKPVISKFSNKGELNAIVTKIFAAAGIKKTLVAKIGGALGKVAGTISNMKDGVKDNATPVDKQTGQEQPDAAMPPVRGN